MTVGTGYKFNSDSTTATATPASGTYATTLNGSGGECGYTGWTNGVAYSILGKTCTIFADDTGNGITYELISIDTVVSPSRMYFGDDSGGKDGSTEAKRPTDVDNTFYLSKCSQADCGN